MLTSRAARLTRLASELLPVSTASAGTALPAAFSRPLMMVLLLGVCGVASCGPAEPSATPPPAFSDEQQSRAEYDVARDLWLNRHSPREALEHALKAAELDSEHAEAAHLVALLYLDFCRVNSHECRLQEAENYARQAAELELREAKNTLGVILIHQRRYDDAIAVLKLLTDDILYRTPENAWGNLGWAYLEKGQADPAIAALQRSVAAQPSFCVGHFRLGVAFERKRTLLAALQAYNRALDPHSGACQGLQEAYAGRARVLQKLNRGEEARKDLLKCVQLDKTTPAGRECAVLLADPK